MSKNEQKALQIIAQVARCPEYSPAMVKRLMTALDVDEKGFALLMNVTPATVRLWMGGVVQPGNTAKRLMQIYAGGPEIIGKIACGQSSERSAYA